MKDRDIQHPDITESLRTGEMSVDDVRAHAQKFSKSYENGPWKTNFEEMAKKTVLKKVMKYAPLKSDFVRGISQDETIKKCLSEDMYTVESTYIETEDYTVDEATGEVLEMPEQEEQDASETT